MGNFLDIEIQVHVDWVDQFFLLQLLPRKETTSITPMSVKKYQILIWARFKGCLKMH